MPLSFSHVLAQFWPDALTRMGDRGAFRAGIVEATSGFEPLNRGFAAPYSVRARAQSVFSGPPDRAVIGPVLAQFWPE